MRTVVFVYESYRERYYSAMFEEREQGFGFAHSYKDNIDKNTVDVS